LHGKSGNDWRRRRKVDKQAYLKQIIDQVQPSDEMKLALFFLLAMPEAHEKAVVKSALQTLKTHNVTEKNQRKTAIAMAIFAASIKQCVKQAQADEWESTSDAPTPRERRH